METDNKFFEDKVRLRCDLLSNGGVRVLDCFAGTGRLWNAVRRRRPDSVTGVVSLDKKGGPLVLRGDNLRFLWALPLSDFGVIDLDAYGNPFTHIRVLNARGWHGRIFFTWVKIGPCEYPAELPIPRGYRRSDRAHALKALSCYTHEIGGSDLEVVLIKRSGGFNIYGSMVM